MSDLRDHAKDSSTAGNRQPLTDEQILHVHEHATDNQPDDGGSYKYLPLVLLFTFSGLVFYGGTYLNKFSGSFDPRIFNEHAKPKALQAAAAIDPMILGQRRYAATSSCITCHLEHGEGQPLASIPPLAGSDWVSSDEKAIRVMLNGLAGAVVVKGETFSNPAGMPNVATQLGFDDATVAAVLTYVRNSFGNSGPPVEPAKVAEIRAKVAGHAQWTAAELNQLK